jgi:hypothetical protein
MTGLASLCRSMGSQQASDVVVDDLTTMAMEA